MSEPKQISPLLDGFTLGNPMSEHDGVRCCPAIKENSEKKYIVKVIAIPAAQAQMDALLLAGAYKDASEAMDYFKTLADDVMQEAELLKKLSRLEGFLAYEGWQMEPITRRRLGYEVYLLGGYRRSLDKFVKKNPITRLEAINLGLDICAALTVCRQAGALYVDLKPANIFVSDKKEYRIGDLGFVSLDALSYTALPDKYRSPYTPPELLDPMASVNLTADTYSLGMILYQIYNDGQLPVRTEGEPLAAPVHADYELAEIILKAIAPDPEDRWQEPKEMGQALVGYMQRNGVNDVPITPYIPLEQEPEGPAEDPAEDPGDREGSADETAPGEEDAQTLLPHEMSEELSKMVAKADDLIAHEPPEGLAVPEDPEPEDPFAFAKTEDEELDEVALPQEQPMEEPAGEEEKKKAGTFADRTVKRKLIKFFTGVGIAVLAAAFAAGGFWAYHNLYIQSVNSLSVSGTRSRLTVHVDSEADEKKLTVTCADQYGNLLTQPVKEGTASFSGLLPSTMYTLSLDISGFHRLEGQTSQVFTTDATTRIVSFTSVAGMEDGSLILNFTVDGEEPAQWNLTYSAPGEEPRQQIFTGHTLTVTGLKLGKVYTFTLDAGEQLSLGGETTLEVMPSRVILARDIYVSAGADGGLTVHWRAPGDIVVDRWKVRCYNGNGFDQELTVQTTEAYFAGVDLSGGCTIEITASGMTQAARASVSSSPITVTGLHVDETDPEKLAIRWDYEGEAPQGGWLLMYGVGGSESPDVIKTDEPSVLLSYRVPDTNYRFTIQAADGTSVLSNVHTFTSGSAPDYAGNNITRAEITAGLVKTPQEENWRFEQSGLETGTEFTAGDPLSMVLTTGADFYHPGEQVDVLYVIRDAGGAVYASLTARERMAWKDIWAGGDIHVAELDIPKVPDFPGSYTVTVLVNGAVLGQADFTLK